MNRQDVYIVDAVRTPMGRAHGRLSAFSVAQLSENILAALKKRNALSSSGVDEVVIGNAVSAGAGQNFVRKALIDAGFAVTTPGHSVGNVCASGLQAVFNGFYRIRSGEADMVIAAGAESVSHMPELIFKKDYEIKKMKDLTESLKHDGLWCSVSNRLMGSLCEDMARQQRITKKEQDDYAFNSYRKAIQGWDQGVFTDEVVVLHLMGNKIFSEDETLRRNIRRELFDNFKSVFEYQGAVTAGNSSSVCDGAAGVLLASSQAVKQQACHPLARIVACSSVAGTAEDAFRLAPQAIQDCADKAGVALEQIDLFEISEAFAAQMVLLQRDLPFLKDQLNIYGGDIALGHPLGAAGIRGLTTLAHAMKRKGAHWGIACVCLGGGGALAVCVERDDRRVH